MEWTDFLTPAERRTLDAMKARHAADRIVMQRIYDRAYKRMARRTKKERENSRENYPQTRRNRRLYD